MTYTTTLSTLRASVYRKLNETSSGDVYDADDINNRLNIRQNYIFRNKYLVFANKAKIYTAYANTTVQTQPSIGDTSLLVNTASGLPTSGAVWINGDIITYTGITTGASYDTLTGIPASGDGSITFAHDTTSEVKPLYLLPDDFGYRTIVYVNSQEMKFKTLQEFLMGGASMYTSVAEGGTQYLLFVSNSSTDKVFMNYQKIPATMTASQVSSIPDDTAENALVYGTCVDMLQEYGDPDGLMANMQQLAEFWEAELQNSQNNMFGSRQFINFDAS